MDWILNNYLEIVSVLTGLVYIALSVRQSIWLWPLGIVSSAFFVVVFFQAKIYADMGLNAYYVIVSIYGWYHWAFGPKREGQQQIDVVRCDPRLWVLLGGITALSTVILGYIMLRFTDSTVPFIDAALAAGSIVATWMLSRKLLENWVMWIVIDLLYIPLYAYKGLYLSIVLYTVFAAMSFVGYRDWKKTMVRD